MSDNIIQLNQELIHNELEILVRSSVVETFNALLDHEAEEHNPEKYKHSGDHKRRRSEHYSRNFQTTACGVKLKIPKLKVVPFETAIIERYRRIECAVEEALIKCISRVFLSAALKTFSRRYGGQRSHLEQ